MFDHSLHFKRIANCYEEKQLDFRLNLSYGRVGSSGTEKYSSEELLNFNFETTVF